MELEHEMIVEKKIYEPKRFFIFFSVHMNQQMGKNTIWQKEKSAQLSIIAQSINQQKNENFEQEIFTSG